MKNKKITCYKKDCKHKWTYKGNQKFYLTCPSCYSKLSIKKLKEILKTKNEKNRFN